MHQAEEGGCPPLRVDFAPPGTKCWRAQTIDHMPLNCKKIVNRPFCSGHVVVSERFPTYNIHVPVPYPFDVCRTCVGHDNL